MPNTPAPTPAQETTSPALTCGLAAPEAVAEAEAEEVGLPDPDWKSWSFGIPETKMNGHLQKPQS